MNKSIFIKESVKNLMNLKRKLLLINSAVIFAPVLVVTSCAKTANDSKEDDDENLQEIFNPAPGQVDKLTADGYVNLVKALELTSETNLLDLTNQQLTTILQSKTNDKSIVKIKSGSTFNENLNLEIHRSNSNEKIEIKITGFNNYLVPEGLLYSDLDFNDQKWKDDNRPLLNSPNLADIDKISASDWVGYVNDFAIYTERGERISSYQELLQKANFQFRIKGKLKVDYLIFDIKLEWPHFKYDQTQQKWVNDSQNKSAVQQINIDSTQTPLPTSK